MNLFLSLLSIFLLAPSISSSNFKDLLIPDITSENFLNDEAQIISYNIRGELDNICRNKFKNDSIPIVVITINQISTYSKSATEIKNFTNVVFKKWINSASNNILRSNIKRNGIILLVSLKDRKARIQLGELFYSKRYDELCQNIMDEKVIPLFKKSEYSAGILNGVLALSNEIKNHENKSNIYTHIFWGIITILVVLIVISFIRNGTIGLAGQLFGFIAIFIGWSFRILFSGLSSMKGNNKDDFWDFGGSDGDGCDGGASGEW